MIRKLSLFVFKKYIIDKDKKNLLKIWKIILEIFLQLNYLINFSQADIFKYYFTKRMLTFLSP
jgi:hypothetical protein